jgi:(1->4)-alpha-D-glucan 1-alpha-D-glucosylmutase
VTLPPAPPRESARRLAREALRAAWTPASTYRLQLTPAFGFREAAALAPYLRELGVGAAYFSPWFQTAPGDPNAYAVTDPASVSRELGGEAGFDRLCGALQEAGLGHLADIVPNHMGVARNAYWDDVLERGPSSPYAHFFDVDWTPVKGELAGKVLLPVLEDFYGRVLEAGLLRLGFEDGRFHVEYRGRRLPVAPPGWAFALQRALERTREKLAAEDASELREAAAEASRGDGEAAARRLRGLLRRSGAARALVSSCLALFNGRKGVPSTYDLLDELLSRQAYRLAHWRAASDEINYRRFFNFNELAALRAEDGRVFERCHALVLRLLAEGRVSGVRVDHPDGLYDPPGYFARLQEGWLRAKLRRAGVPPEEADALLAEEEFRGGAPLFVVAEKILDRREPLPAEWRVRGTAGYEFLNALGGLFVDRGREEEVSAVYEQFIGRRKDFPALIYAAKRLFLRSYMAGEIESLGHRLNALSETSRYHRDFTRRSLTAAVREVIACFPVYRTYISPRETAPTERDERYIKVAVAKARKAAPELGGAVFDYLEEVLLLKLEPRVPEEQRPRYRDFVLRLQQLTAPVMAKGLEDTAFYIDHRLISLNEVGGDPAHFGGTPAEFHRLNQERAERWTGGLSTASTHDTKRSEDVRLRIHALSELAPEWKSEVSRWAVLNERHKTLLRGALEPDRDVEYFLYQSLVGAWPEPGDGEEGPAFTQRVKAYALKSAREAKSRTDWLDPDREYEQALERFIDAALRPGEDNAFLKAFRPFQRRVAALGRLNALSALTLRLAAPGVPDVYQGEELWRLSLVDPDNRRPVDFARRRQALDRLRALAPRGRGRHRAETVASLLEKPEDGLIKMFLLREGLRERRRDPELFERGGYEPVAAVGPRAEQVVAFLRAREGRCALAAAGRFFSRLPAGPGAWEGTRLLLPRSCRSRWFREAFTGRRLRASAEGGRASLEVSELFGTLGAALLLGNHV